ncbi:MAG: cupin domain-containing protein [Rhizobiales bacterium]|nr:cupin domain-containing protein [Hyphomicrobiales bacterium]
MSASASAKGKLSGPGEGTTFSRANQSTVKVAAADTNGTFEVLDEICKPGFQSRLHLHTRSYQTCYVMEGSGDFLVGDKTFHADTGSCVHIPPGVAHQVSSRDGMRMLMVYSPAGIGAMFAAMYALTPEQLKDSDLTRNIAAEHDTIIVADSAGGSARGTVLG